MTHTIPLPWALWYGREPHPITLPEGWQVTVAHMVGGPDIGDAGIRRALADPIGAPRLRDLARGRRDAAILIDDLTRPTPCERLLPYVLEELAAGGLGDDRVRIICAVAAHRALVRADLLHKIGPDLLGRLEVIVHNAYDDLEFYGHSSQGIPIWVNRALARSDLKIAAGMITPRGGMFGGGAKLLLPGACGRETIYAHHAYCPPEAFRQHIDEVAELVGLAYIVNPLLNAELGIMALVAGNPRPAFARGEELGRALYRTEAPEEADVVICNAWPKDTEGTQAGMARVPLYGSARRLVREGGTVVIASAAPEGLGFHSVLGPGTHLRRLAEAREAAGGAPPYETVLYSPHLSAYDARALFGAAAPFFREWAVARAYLERTRGPMARCTVFPYATMQYVP